MIEEQNASTTPDSASGPAANAPAPPAAGKPGGDMNPALINMWKEYRKWAATGRSLKSKLTRWRRLLLISSVVGALLASVSQTLSSHLSYISTVVGVISAALLALAAYFTKEILTHDRESNWIRSRAAAEALKSESYLLATGSTPYDTGNPKIAFDKIDLIVDGIKGVSDLPISETDSVKGMPKLQMGITDYIKDRLQPQIDFYKDKIDGYQGFVTKLRIVTISLGAVAVVLGAIALKGILAGWVGVIGTISASIAAFLYSERFQFLITSYTAASRKLERTKSRFDPAAATDKEKSDFISKCEEIMRTETSAWIAEWSGGK